MYIHFLSLVELEHRLADVPSSALTAAFQHSRHFWARLFPVLKCSKVSVSCRCWQLCSNRHTALPSTHPNHISVHVPLCTCVPCPHATLCTCPLFCPCGLTLLVNQFIWFTSLLKGRMLPASASSGLMTENQKFTDCLVSDQCFGN